MLFKYICCALFDVDWISSFFSLSFAKPLINVFDVLVLITKSIYLFICAEIVCFVFCVCASILLYEIRTLQFH